MSERSVRLRCANAEFGTYTGQGGTMEVVCRASRCRRPDGVTVHLFDCSDGSYRTEVRPFRSPRELIGAPFVEVRRHG